MGTDHIAVLSNKLQSSIKQLSLNPEQRIEVQNVISKVIRTYVEEIEDPFKEIKPTFNKLTNHEKNLKALIEELTEVSKGFGKMVKNTKAYSPVTVRRNHRIVIKELSEGTSLRKEVYLSKRSKACPNCKGTGKTALNDKCVNCNGEGTYHPVRGVMLEVI